MAPEKSKILIIGGTGYIGQFVVEASANAGHPTSILVRESTAADPRKSKLIDNFKNSGVTLVFGDLYDHQSLVNAIKQADVVISTVGKMQILDQTKIIAAIKEAENIKRFLPSEFGIDVDHQNAIEPAGSMFAEKVQIRRAIEAERIPFTYIACNCFSGYFLPTLAQPGAAAAAVPPRDKVTIHGDGTPKAVFNEEHDIGTYTIKAVDDPKTLNKILYIKPPKNTWSLNELVSLWEKKIGKSLERSYVNEEQLLKLIQGFCGQRLQDMRYLLDPVQFTPKRDYCLWTRRTDDRRSSDRRSSDICCFRSTTASGSRHLLFPIVACSLASFLQRLFGN